MKKNTKIIIGILSSLFLLSIAFYLLIGNPAVFIRNRKLETSMKSITAQTVQLNEVVPFDWDAVYTFPPYMSKEDMEEILGFKSPYIQENQINEGMVHLIFVKDQKVMACILGYPENLGFSMDIAAQDIWKIDFDDHAEFDVTKKDGMVELTCKSQL